MLVIARPCSCNPFPEISTCFEFYGVFLRVSLNLCDLLSTKPFMGDGLQEHVLQ